MPSKSHLFAIVWSSLKVVAAWEEKGNNRRIANMDGEDLVPDRMVGGLVQEMSGDIMISVSGET